MPEKFAIGWVRMLIENQQSYMKPIRRSLCFYLNRTRSDSLKNMTVAELADALLTPPTDWRYYADKRRDFLMTSFHNLGEMLRSRGDIRRAARLCEEPSHVKEVIKWMYLLCGREVSTSDNLNESQAMQVAETQIGISADEYAERAIAWQRFNPWTIVVAKEEDKTIAMCIVLPLTTTAYAAVREGRMRSHDLTVEEHFEAPSTHLLIEGIAIRPPEYGLTKLNPTMAVMRLGLCQIGVFCFRPKLRTGDISLLTFGGTPRNQKRLYRQGYRPVGKRMAETNVPLYELLIPRRSYSMKRWFLRGLLRMTGYSILSPPKP